MPNAKASKKLEHDRRDNCGMDPRAASSARQGGFSRLGPSLCLAHWGVGDVPKPGAQGPGAPQGEDKSGPQGLQVTLSDVLQPKGKGSTAGTWHCCGGLGYSRQE